MNVTIAKFENINFKPKSIFYILHPAEKTGYCDVQGVVDVSNTPINVTSTQRIIPRDYINKKIMIISSTHEIKGTPKIEWDFLYNKIRDRYLVDCLTEDKHLYLVVRKI